MGRIWPLLELFFGRGKCLFEQQNSSRLQLFEMDFLNLKRLERYHNRVLRMEGRCSLKNTIDLRKYGSYP